MVQQRWHHSIICFVCKDHLPNHVRRVRIGDNEDGTPKFRCYDNCDPGSPKWMAYQEALPSSKRSQFYQTFKRAATKRSENTKNNKKIREEKIKAEIIV